MKSIFKKKLLLAAVTLLCISANAQDKKNGSEEFNDYVITTKGDTIRSKVNTPLFSGPSYQTAQMSEPKKIKIGDIKEYYVKQRNIIFRAVVLDRSPRRLDFMPVVENGTIRLYQDIYTSQYSAAWYVSKGTDTAFLLKQNDILLTSRKKREGKFADMLKDKPAVSDKFLTEDKFSYQQLRDIVHLYNISK